MKHKRDKGDPQPRGWYAPVVFVLAAFLLIIRYSLDIDRRRHDRDQFVRQVHSAVNLGDTRDAVLAAFSYHRRYGFLAETNSPDRWTFTSSPSHWAWSLVVEFRNDRVSAVKIRNDKGANPRSAPADKIPH